MGAQYNGQVLISTLAGGQYGTDDGVGGRYFIPVAGREYIVTSPIADPDYNGGVLAPAGRYVFRQESMWGEPYWTAERVGKVNADGFEWGELTLLNLGSDWAGPGKQYNKPLLAINPRTGRSSAVYAGTDGAYYFDDRPMPAGASLTYAGGPSFDNTTSWFDKTMEIGIIAGLAAISGGAAAPALAAATGASVAVAGGAVTGATAGAIRSEGDLEATLTGAALGAAGGAAADFIMPAAPSYDAGMADYLGLNTPQDIAAVGESVGSTITVAAVPAVEVAVVDPAPPAPRDDSVTGVEFVPAPTYSAPAVDAPTLVLRGGDESAMADLLGLNTPQDIVEVGASVDVPVTVSVPVPELAVVDQVRAPIEDTVTRATEPAAQPAPVQASAPEFIYRAPVIEDAPALTVGESFSEPAMADLLGLQNTADQAVVANAAAAPVSVESIVAPAALVDKLVNTVTGSAAAAGVARITSEIKKAIAGDGPASSSAPPASSAAPQGASSAGLLILFGLGFGAWALTR